MADIFLSYRNTPERRAFVKRLALLLRAHEISVWWDYGLEAGESYRAQITEELSKARLVAPLWCAESIASKWVAMEAELGRDKLIPARLQKVIPPQQFEAIQAADLIGWTGAVDYPRALAYVGKICERLRKPSRAPVDMMEELADLRPLAPLPEVGAAAVSRAPGQDFVLADLRATWVGFQFKNDSAAVEKLLARVRGTAPGSGLEFEIEHHIDVLRDEAVRREAAQAAQARAEVEGARRQAEIAAAHAEELKRRRTPGAEWRDGEGFPLMVTIPAGKFLMGSPPNEQGHEDDEGPQREVTIAQPFALSKYAVTFEEWDAAIAAGAKLHKPNDHGWGRARRPVIDVSWEDAQIYAAWLNRALEGGSASPPATHARPEAARSNLGAYRLPSEAEWEYACRAGTTTRYSTGAIIRKSQAQFSESVLGSAKQTVPVGSFPANAFGLHDMHGNIWEWVQDGYTAKCSGAPNDGSASETNSLSRVLRGGGWYNNPRMLRSAKRNAYASANRFDNGGVRLARTIL